MSPLPLSRKISSARLVRFPRMMLPWGIELSLAPGTKSRQMERVHPHRIEHHPPPFKSCTRKPSRVPPTTESASQGPVTQHLDRNLQQPSGFGPDPQSRVFSFEEQMVDHKHDSASRTGNFSSETCSQPDGLLGAGSRHELHGATTGETHQGWVAKAIRNRVGAIRGEPCARAAQTNGLS